VQRGVADLRAGELERGAQARGIDAGLKIVPPGGKFAARVEIGAS